MSRETVESSKNFNETPLFLEGIELKRAQRDHGVNESERCQVPGGPTVIQMPPRRANRAPKVNHRVELRAIPRIIYVDMTT